LEVSYSAMVLCDVVDVVVVVVVVVVINFFLSFPARMSFCIQFLALTLFLL
jgi:hypothetical protein